MRARVRYLTRFFQKRFVQYPVVSILLLLLLAYLAATIVIAIYEDIGLTTAALKALPAFLGEVGELETRSPAVELSTIVALIASIGFMAVITAKVTTVFVEFVRRGGSMAKKVNFSDHTIICGWNFQGQRIIEELLSGGQKRRQEIVILANTDERPIKEERVEFVSGDPSQDNDLLRVGIKEAKSVIVLSDLSKGANEADAEALMITLAVESLNRKVHTCVQIVNSGNRTHLERAHADEIICLDQLGGCLAVASALNHGVSSIVSELLTFNRGCEIYRYDKDLSDGLIGKEFIEAVKLLADECMLLLAVETDNSKELRQQLSKDAFYLLEEDSRLLIVNPQSQYQVRQGDALFVIAESEPIKL